MTREVAARSARLKRRGLRPGDRVFLHSGNRLEFFAELLAVWRLGACAVPVDPRLTRVELERLADVFRGVLAALRPGGYCCVVVMDLRKKDQFFPFHSDLAASLQRLGFLWDDLIVWNRQAEYNNLRPLGYPAVFRVNKVHEFVVILRKPPPAKGTGRKARPRSAAGP